MVKKDYTIYHYTSSGWIKTIVKGHMQYKCSSSINQGYEQNNTCSLWLFYKDNSDLDNKSFNIGDIIVEGNCGSITKQSDITNTYFNITSIQKNNYGTNQVNHIFIEGK